MYYSILIPSVIDVNWLSDIHNTHSVETLLSIAAPQRGQRHRRPQAGRVYWSFWCGHCATDYCQVRTNYSIYWAAKWTWNNDPSGLDFRTWAPVRFDSIRGWGDLFSPAMFILMSLYSSTLYYIIIVCTNYIVKNNNDISMIWEEWLTSRLDNKSASPTWLAGCVELSSERIIN